MFKKEIVLPSYLHIKRIKYPPPLIIAQSSILTSFSPYSQSENRLVLTRSPAMYLADPCINPFLEPKSLKEEKLELITEPVHAKPLLNLTVNISLSPKNM